MGAMMETTFILALSLISLSSVGWMILKKRAFTKKRNLLAKNARLTSK
jgi:hypothetical protein